MASASMMSTSGPPPTTSSPWATRCAVRYGPTKPWAPVTNALTERRAGGGGARPPSLRWRPDAPRGARPRRPPWSSRTDRRGSSAASTARCAGWSSRLSAVAAGPRPEGLDGVPYVDLGWPRGPLRYEAWHRLGRPRLVVGGEVVHATSLAVPPPGDRPLVVTVHDLVPLRAPELLTRRGVGFHRAGLERARRLGATLVVPTAWGREDLAAEGIDPSLVHVAPHGVDVGPAPTPEA